MRLILTEDITANHSILKLKHEADSVAPYTENDECEHYKLCGFIALRLNDTIRGRTVALFSSLNTNHVLNSL